MIPFGQLLLSFLSDPEITQLLIFKYKYRYYLTMYEFLMYLILYI